MAFKIHELYNGYCEAAEEAFVPPSSQYQLAGLVDAASGGRTRLAEELRPREAWNLIETLKAIVNRTIQHVEGPPVSIHRPAKSSDPLPF
jgi:hypothetical protein